MIKVLPLLAAFTVFLGGSSLSKAALVMEIIADNDFAMLVGTNSSVTRLLYQNNVQWPEQVAEASSFNISLLAGEDTFYLLGLGGGGTEDIGGKVNGVALNTIFVQRSTDISSYLSGYFDQLGIEYAGRIKDVEEGTYSVLLADVQTALPNVTWGAPVTKNSGVGSIPTGTAFTVATNSAMLFKFSAGDVGVTASAAVPEPGQVATSLLLVAGIGGYVFWKKRKAAKGAAAA